MGIPDVLTASMPFNLKTELPDTETLRVNQEWPICIYDFYNLDPTWRKDMQSNRVLLLEPSFFKLYPVSSHTIEFLLKLAKNIPGIQTFVGEFNDLRASYPGLDYYFKEHPAHPHYRGEEDQRDWIFPQITGYHQSFTQFWKKCEKFLKAI